MTPISTNLEKVKKYKSLEPYCKDFFYWYGEFAFKNRWFLFIIPLIITPFLSVGFYWFNELRIDDPAYVFTPKDARWKQELATFSNLWPLDEIKFQPGKSFEPRRFVNILCKAKDGGNVLRLEILNEIQLLNKFIMENITIPTTDGQYNLTYHDLCLSYDWVCGGNEHIAMFMEMEQVGRVIDLTFPKGGNKDTPVYLGTVLGDILLNKSDNHVIEARITQLFYFLKQESEIIQKYSTSFEYAVERFILNAFESNLITISFAHYQSLQDGLDENAQRFLPNFVISFTSLTIYCIICAFVLKKHSNSFFAIDWIRSKPYIAIAGLFNTLITLISAFGLMLLIGKQYNVINTIIPFLIIAIGIDDMFIMTACYDQVDKYLPNHVRIAEMMRNAGVAVSITNITDILSFLIGCLTDLPGVELFCTYAFVCVLFCYIYQLTFFTGLMAIMSVAEKEERHCLFFYKIKTDLNDEKKQKSEKLFTNSKNSLFCNKKLQPPLMLDNNPNKKINNIFLNTNKIYDTSCEKDGVTEKSFYNRNIEFCERPPSIYEYCTLEKVNRRNADIKYSEEMFVKQKNESYCQNILIDDDTEKSKSNFSLTSGSSDSFVLSSGNASTATIKTEFNNDQSINSIIKKENSIGKKWKNLLTFNVETNKKENNLNQTKKNNNFSIVFNDNIKQKNQQFNFVELDKDSNQKFHEELKNINELTINKKDLFNAQKTFFDKKSDANSLKEIYSMHIPQLNYFDKPQLPNLNHLSKNYYHTNLLQNDKNYCLQHTASENITHRFFSLYYGPNLLKNNVRLFVIIIYIIYITLAMLGCSQFREGLEPSHLVTANHYIAKYFNDIKMFWQMGAQLHVAVLNPPNFTDPVQRTQLMNLVSAFENTDYTMGREGTVFFLLEYINYLNHLNADFENTERIWHKKLRSWLKFTGGSEQWERDIVYDKKTKEFKAFRFQIAMKNIVEPNQHKLATKLLRKIADNQPFNVIIYHEAFPFADQYLIILPSTYRNVLISLCVMTVIAFLLIPSIPSAILIVLSIVSICVGVFGYMTFWNVNLDAISMISIIMSIGFAVDLSAHIVYAFVTAHGDTKERVIGALEHLGWPIFQGATSTIAGITVLVTVDAYIILTFFKTIWLTMVLGLAHGLIFIPVMLSFIPISFFRIPA